LRVAFRKLTGKKKQHPGHHTKRKYIEYGLALDPSCESAKVKEAGVGLLFGPFRLDAAQGTLFRGDQAIAAQPGALTLISCLAARKGRVVSKEELLRSVWPDTHVSDDALHQMLKRARAALGDDPASPRYIETVPRKGWRFIAPVELEGKAAEPGELVGRGELLTEVLDKLRAEPGIYTLHGPGGIGKTHLATTIGLYWSGPVRTIELVGLSDMLSIVQALCLQLRLHLGNMSVETMTRLVGVELASLGEALLILDNAEHLPQSWAVCLKIWLEEAPHLRILVTSQHLLQLEGEQVVRVPPLSKAAARLLFETQAGKISSDPWLDTLLERLDFQPLSIRLAASKIRYLTPAELLSRLDRRMEVLGEPGVGRHHSLQASLQASWELLEQQDRQALSGLSVIEGRFYLEDAEAILGEVALEELGRLEQRALVQCGQQEGRTWFQLLESTRLFAGSQPEGVDAALKWAEWVVQQAEQHFWSYHF
jgi:DNA-binding winged helix-turn-helix (wHTH) protein/predicted ATPase